MTLLFIIGALAIGIVFYMIGQNSVLIEMDKNIKRVAD